MVTTEEELPMRQAEGKTSSWLPVKEATMGEGSHDNLRGLRLAHYKLSSREEQRAMELKIKIRGFLRDFLTNYNMEKRRRC